MVKTGRQRRIDLGIPIAVFLRAAELERLRRLGHAMNHKWRPRRGGTCFIEVFAGKGKLAQAFIDAGITALARVDIEGVGALHFD